MSGLTEAQVLAEVRAALSVVLEVDASAVGPDTRFGADLAADSLAMIELVEILEERLAAAVPGGLHIPDADVETLVSVGDVVGYILARMRVASAGGGR